MISFGARLFQLLLDTAPSARGDAWLRGLRRIAPEGFTTAMRTEASQLFSQTSKGVHQELVIPASAQFDVTTVSDILNRTFELLAGLGITASSSPSNTGDIIYPTAGRIRALSTGPDLMTGLNPPADQNLVLASEDFDKQEFRRLHRFSKNDERVIAKLIAHGPVLLQGSRGSGKSALLREASYRLAIDSGAPALGVYISLRHMPLLTSVGNEYQRILCELMIDQVQRALVDTSYSFNAIPTLAGIQAALTDLAQLLQKRLVIMFDDAAHIGREASLGDFFDIFRTLSSSTISCKATIYPGVTNFGKRFDVHNDATVVDVIRDEQQPGFGDFFSEIISVRYPEIV